MQLDQIHASDELRQIFETFLEAVNNEPARLNRAVASRSLLST